MSRKTFDQIVGELLREVQQLRAFGWRQLANETEAKARRILARSKRLPGV